MQQSDSPIRSLDLCAGEITGLGQLVDLQGLYSLDGIFTGDHADCITVGYFCGPLCCKKT